MNRKGLEERKNDLKSQLSALLDTAKAEKRELTNEETTQFDDLEREIKEINSKIEREDKRSNMENTEVMREEGKEFVQYIRNVLENRADANLTVGKNGTIIPHTIANKIIMTAYDQSSILKSATKYNTNGKLTIPKYTNDGGTDVAMAYADEFTELESKILGL